MPSIESAAVTAVVARAAREVEQGRITAGQLAVGLHGEVVAAHAFGAATDDSRFIIFSATKTLVAMALLPHFGDGTLELTAPVARYLPEFAANGKGDVTVLQLLTMQGGFPQAPIGPDRWGTSTGRRAQFAEWTLAWPAGTRTEYHPMAAHWVIAELIEALTGAPYADVIHDRVFAPAGVPQLLGTPPAPPIEVRSVGERPAEHAALVEVFGREDLVPIASVGPAALLSMNDPRAQAAAVPGGGAIGRATDLALVYQNFLHNRGGLPPDWLADAIATVRNGSINTSDGVPANRTIAGYIAGSDGYHRHRWMPAAAATFGHHGAGGQLCWVDPRSGLSFCFLHDTLHQDPRVEFTRSAELNDLATAIVARG